MPKLIRSVGDRVGLPQCPPDLSLFPPAGHHIFYDSPADAIRHYEVGLRIGELSLGELADGLLPWGWLAG